MHQQSGKGKQRRNLQYKTRHVVYNCVCHGYDRKYWGFGFQLCFVWRGDIVTSTAPNSTFVLNPCYPDSFHASQSMTVADAETI